MAAEGTLAECQTIGAWQSRWSIVRRARTENTHYASMDIAIGEARSAATYVATRGAMMADGKIVASGPERSLRPRRLRSVHGVKVPVEVLPDGRSNCSLKW